MSCWSVLLGIAAVVVLAALVAGWWLYRRDSRPTQSPPRELTEAQRRWRDVKRAERFGEMTTEFPRIYADDEEGPDGP